MREGDPLGLALYVSLYPFALAVLLHLAQRSQRFERRHLLAGALLTGFLLGVGSNLAFIYLLGGFSQFQALTAGQTLIVGLLTAWRLFAIAYIWATYPEHRWAAALLAGLMTMESGPLGLRIVAAAAGQGRAWLSVDWSLAFFILGVLTHTLLRVGVPVGHRGYYRLSVGRVLLVLMLVPVAAMLSWCGSAIIFGPFVFPGGGG